MEYGAIDLHTRRSEIRIVDEAGTVTWTGRVDTTQAGLHEAFGRRAPLRILVESSTGSGWAAAYLESLGHEVIVADPNYLPMYGARSRRVKTDKRDAAALAEACRVGIYRRAHRVSAEARELRQTLRVRQHLVQMRTRTINVVRAMLRQDGLRLPGGAPDSVERRLERVRLSAAAAEILAPLRLLLRELGRRIAALEDVVEARATADPTTQRLMTAPGVGPIVALTFQAVLDTPDRFGGEAARASAFVGLVPSEQSSGERQRKGHITKTGPRDLRALLVQASWVIWRGRTADAAALRDWAQALASRRGKRMAVVALARRLSRILYAMWRDQTDFGHRRRRAAAAA